MNDDREYEAFLKGLGGRHERDPDAEDSIVEAAWRIGEHWSQVSATRLTHPNSASIFPVAIIDTLAVNAVAARLETGYCAAIHLPLIHTLANVCAAVWAHPGVLPDMIKSPVPKVPYAFEEPVVPGFDLVRAVRAAEQNGGLATDPSAEVQGISHRQLADLITTMGDARLNLTMATFHAAVEFVWCHEFAHILYGHVDVVERQFGVKTLFEVSSGASTRVPAALSQFLEHVADMDGASQVIAAKYGPLFEEGRSPTEDDKIESAATILGIFLGMYALQQVATLYGREKSVSLSHPPLTHRATWVMGAESSVPRALVAQRNIEPASSEFLSDMRQTTISLLRQVASTNESLHGWIARVDEQAEQDAQSYLDSLWEHASGYFDELSVAQMV
jgi:hypothetical protein